jgi:hypothetical protein
MRFTVTFYVDQRMVTVFWRDMEQDNYYPQVMQLFVDMLID